MEIYFEVSVGFAWKNNLGFRNGLQDLRGV